MQRARSARWLYILGDVEAAARQLQIFFVGESLLEEDVAGGLGAAGGVPGTLLRAREATGEVAHLAAHAAKLVSEGTLPSRQVQGNDDRNRGDDACEGERHAAAIL